MDSPLVSVFMVTYNHEKYITQAIESVLTQKTTFQIKLFIGDDCSTDKTQLICKKYQSNNPAKIELVFNQSNVGATINAHQIYNACFSSGAKYTAMLEGDDYWTDPLKLQKQIDFLENNNEYVMHCHNAFVVYENDIIDKHLFNRHPIKETMSFSDITEEWNIPTASIVFRRLAIPKLPEWFTSIHHGDYALALMLADKGLIKYSPEIMCVYRKQFGSMSFNPKINSEYASDRLIQLFRYVNIETGYRHNKEIQPIIDNLHSINRKLKIKRNYPFLFPKFLLKQILLKFGFKVYRNHSKGIIRFNILNLHKHRR